MIVRIMGGGGQYRVDDSLLERGIVERAGSDRHIDIFHSQFAYQVCFVHRPRFHGVAQIENDVTTSRL